MVSIQRSFYSEILLGLLLSCFCSFAQSDVQLLLDPIPAVVDGTALSVSGSVVPADADLSLAGNTITLAGDGSFSHDLVLLPGTNVLRFAAAAAGFEPVSQSVTLIADLTAPTISITSPDLIHFTNQDTLTVQLRLDDAEDRRLTLSRDGLDLVADELLWNDRDLALDVAADRTTSSFTYVVRDRAGRQASQTLTVHRKVSLPAVDLQLSQNQALPGETIDLDLALQTDDEITSVEVVVNGQSAYRGVDATPVALSFAVPEDVGAVPVEVHLADRFGNTHKHTAVVQVLQPAYVFGTVRDHSNSHPLANVTVALTTDVGTLSQTTDEAGRFRFFTHGQPQSLRASHPDFTTVIRNHASDHKSWRVADVRLSPLSHATSLAPYRAVVTLANAAAGLQVAALDPQNLTSLLPNGFIPLGGTYVLHAGSASLTLAHAGSSPAAGYQLLWLFKAVDSSSWQVRHVAPFSQGAQQLFSSLTDGSYLLVATAHTPPNVGALLTSSTYTPLQPGDVLQAQTEPARVSLLDQAQTNFTIRIAHPSQAQPATTLAQAFYREVHDRFAGQVTLPDQTLDLWLYPDWLDQSLRGSLPVASRLEVSPQLTRKATLHFQAQPGPLADQGLALVDTLKTGEVTLTFADASDQTLAKSLLFVPQADVPSWNGATALTSFHLQIAAIANQSPTLTFAASTDALKVILLRQHETYGWIYAGMLARKGRQWQAAPQQIDMRGTGTYALLALDQDVTEIRGTVTHQGNPVADAVLRHGNHPFGGMSGNQAYGSTGLYRFFVPQQPRPDDAFLSRVPYLYTVTATDPATQRQGSTVIADTLNVPILDQVAIELDDPSFALINHEPLASEIGVALNPEIMLAFDTELTADASQRAAGLSLTSAAGTVIPFDHYLSVDRRNLYLTPLRTLNEQTAYTLAINANLQDRFGNPAAPTAFTFTTLTKASLPDLALSTFYIEPRGDAFYLVGPEASFAAGTELQIVMTATADAYTQTLSGPGYEFLLTDYAPGDTLYLYAKAPNGQEGTHSLDVVKLAADQYRIGSRPFSVALDANTTLHITGLQGTGHEAFTIALLDTAMRDNLTQTTPILSDSGWSLAHGIRIEPVDGTSDLVFEGRLEVAGLPSPPEGESYFMTHVREGVIAPASPEDPSNMVAHNLVNVLGKIEPPNSGKTRAQKRYALLAGFFLGGAGAFILGRGSGSSSVRVYSEIPAAQYQEAKQALPELIFTAEGLLWHQKARSVGKEPYGPAWVWGTNHTEANQQWYFLGAVNQNCEINSRYPGIGQGTMRRIEGIDRWKGGRVVAENKTLTFGSNDLNDALEVEASLALSWSVVKSDGSAEGALPQVPAMGTFPLQEDAEATAQLRNFRRVIHDDDRYLKATLASSGSSKVFQTATLYAPVHDPIELNLNGTQPGTLYFPVKALPKGNHHQVRILFTFANEPDQSFEQDFLLLASLNDDIDTPGAPSVAGVFPGDGERNVETFPWMQLAFTESVKNIPEGIQLLDLTDNSAVPLLFRDVLYQPIESADSLVASVLAQPRAALKLEHDYQIRIDGVVDREDNAFSWLNPESGETQAFFTSKFSTTVPEIEALNQAPKDLWHASIGRRMNNLILTLNREDNARDFSIKVYDARQKGVPMLSDSRFVLSHTTPTQRFWVDFFTPDELASSYPAEDFRAQNQQVNRRKLGKVPTGTLAVISIDHTTMSDRMYFMVYNGTAFVELGEVAHRNGPFMRDQVKMGPYLACAWTSFEHHTFAQTYDIRDYYKIFLELGGTQNADISSESNRFTRKAAALQPHMILPVPGNPVDLAAFTWREVDEEGVERILYGLTVPSSEYPAIFAFDPKQQTALPTAAFGKTRSLKTRTTNIYDPRLLLPTDYSQLTQINSNQAYAATLQGSGVAEGIVIPSTTPGNDQIADVAVVLHTANDTRVSELLFYVLPKTRQVELKAAELAIVSNREIFNLEVDRSSGKMAMTVARDEGFELVVVDLVAYLNDALQPQVGPVDILDDAYVVFKKAGYYDDLYLEGEMLLATDTSDRTLQMIKLAPDDYRENGWLIADLESWMQPRNPEEETDIRILNHEYQVFYASDRALPENTASADQQLYMELGTYEMEVKPRETLSVTLKSIAGNQSHTFPVFTNDKPFAVRKAITPYPVRQWIEANETALRTQGYLAFELEITARKKGITRYHNTVQFFYAYRMPPGGMQDGLRYGDNLDLASQTPHVGLGLANLSSIDPRLDLSPRMLLHNAAQFQLGHYGVGSSNGQMLQAGLPIWWQLDGIQGESDVDLTKAFPRLVFQQPQTFETEIQLETDAAGNVIPKVRQGLGVTFERDNTRYWQLDHRQSMHYRLNTTKDLPNYRELFASLNEAGVQLKDARFPVFRVISDPAMPASMMAPALINKQQAQPYHNEMSFKDGFKTSVRPRRVEEKPADMPSGRHLTRSYGQNRHVMAIQTETLPNNHKIRYSYDDHGYLVKIENSHPKLIELEWQAIESLEPMGDFKLKRLKTLRFGAFAWTYTYQDDTSLRLSSVAMPTIGTQTLEVTAGTQIPGLAETVTVRYEDGSAHTFTYAVNEGAYLTTQYQRDTYINALTWAQQGDAEAKDWAIIGTTSPAQSYVYDRLGRLTSATNAYGTSTWTYQAGAYMDEIATATNPLGEIITYTIDREARTMTPNNGSPLKRLISASGAVYGQTFEGVDRSATGTVFYTPAGGDYSLSVTGKQITAPLHGLGKKALENAKYNVHGQLLSGKVNGQDVKYTYDDLGRVVKMARGKQSVTYAYAQATGLLSVTTTHAPSGNVSTERYDPFGRMVSSSQTLMGSAGNPSVVSSTYTYDDLNRVTEVDQTISDSPGRTLTYSYIGETQALASWSDSAGATVTYTPTGEGVGVNGMAIEQDGLSRNLAHTTDRLGRVIQSVMPRVGTVALEYDGWDRLIKATAAGEGTGKADSLIYSRTFSDGAVTIQDALSGVTTTWTRTDDHGNDWSYTQTWEENGQQRTRQGKRALSAVGSEADFGHQLKQSFSLGEVKQSLTRFSGGGVTD